MRAPAFIEPSCEALTNGSAHPSSHLMGAKRLKEGESVYLAFLVHLRKRTIHPSPRLPEKPILAKCEQRHFAQQPLQRERAWVTRGCMALERRSFQRFLKRPRKATANMYLYIKNQKKMLIFMLEDLFQIIYGLGLRIALDLPNLFLK